MDLKEILGFVASAGPLVAPVLMIWLYFERDERLTLTRERNALLERVLTTMGGNTQTMRELKALVTGQRPEE